jgi:diguanylate cyclase (GGDEF)-like protein
MVAFVAYQAESSRGTADAVVYAALLVALALLAGFARDFLDLPHTAPMSWRLLCGAFAFVVVEEGVYAFAPSLIARAGVWAALDPLAIATLLLGLFAAGIASWRSGNVAARYYCLGIAGVVAGLLIGIAGRYGAIPPTAMTRVAPGIGVAWGAIVLAIALADRIRLLSAQTEALEGERDAMAAAAMRDALTGIANRGAFDRRLVEEWRRGARTRSRLAIVLIDVDRFKAYNDRYGHLRGDRVLTRVAHTIAETVRRPEDFVARYGGEEFVVVLPGCSRENAARIADGLRRSVHALAIPHDKSELTQVTISAGVASAIPRHDLDPATLVAAADRALYAAKRGGRNRVSMTGAATGVSA